MLDEVLFVFVFIIFRLKKSVKLGHKCFGLWFVKIGTLVDMYELKQTSVCIRTKFEVFVIEFDRLLLT